MHHCIVFLGKALHSLKCPSAPRRTVREIHWGVRLLIVVGNGDKLRQRGATWLSLRAHPSWGESTLRGWIPLFLSVCLPVCLSACLFVCLSVCLPVCLSACLFVYLSVCLPVCLSACLFVCWSVIMTIQVSEKEWARLHVYHTVCLG